MQTSPRIGKPLDGREPGPAKHARLGQALRSAVSRAACASWAPVSSLMALWACGPRAPADAPVQLQEPEGARDEERRRMLETQLAGRIHDPRVLAAMSRVPRHRFVPPEQRAAAYHDRPLPIGLDQTISQPFIVAFMSQALELTGDERVLEVGCGSGYQAAILGELAREVWTIEILAPLAERAAATLAELGHANVHVGQGDGYLGWPEHAPFDAILVAAAPDHVPEPLLEQLALGGRMILPIGERDQELVLLRRTRTGIQRESILPVRFVPMTGLAEER